MKSIEEELMLKRQQIEEKELEDSEAYIRRPSFSSWVIAAAVILFSAGFIIYLIEQF